MLLGFDPLYQDEQCLDGGVWNGEKLRVKASKHDRLVYVTH